MAQMPVQASLYRISASSVDCGALKVKDRGHSNRRLAGRRKPSSVTEADISGPGSGEHSGEEIQL